ncbi:hypothetical protein [Bacillus sp. 3255]|uniref:hypothetical protein n=1 Tax=Bacillus sp. 3255 TaxID=2817904 RepID=UPI0028609599|nr:hypothetical protein [Bacillus sp. 3255]MDR6884881.1 hypothetical protein [Bacillus sp. 3255]
MKVSDNYLEGLKTVLRMGNRSFERKTVIRLIEHIEEVEAEKVALLQHIECEVDRQKLVTLPLHVAEAIEFFRAAGVNDTTILGIMYGVYFENDGTHASTLFNYRESGGGINIANALVNDYKVETLEDRIKAAVLNYVEEQSEENVGYIIANDSEEFSQQITEIVTKIIREDQEAIQ